MTEDQIIPFVQSLDGKSVAEAHGQILGEILRLLVQIRDNTEATKGNTAEISWNTEHK